MKTKILLLLMLIPYLIYAQLAFHFFNAIPVSQYGQQMPNAWAGGINFPVWSEIDINRDGAPDLFMFDRSNNKVLVFVNDNVSGSSSYHEDASYAKHFPQMNGWAFLFDYNYDGLPDLFTVSSLNNGIAQYKANYSTSGGWSFTLVEASMKADYGGGNIFNVLASSNLVPHFSDIDNDGDMDILGQQFTCLGTYAYYKNYSMENFGTPDSLNQFKLETNSWGRFSLRAGLFNHVAVGNWNVNCRPLEPLEDFFPPEDLLARQDDTYSVIYTIDLDGDSDKDALIGDSGARNLLMVVNGGTPSNAQMVSQDTLFPSNSTPVDIPFFNSCAYIDLDNDSKRDLIVSNFESENKRGVWFYKNNGTNAMPVFSLLTDSLLQPQMIDVGEGASAVFFDADADGKLDLIIGNTKSTIAGLNEAPGLTYLRNTGSITQPAFEYITGDYAGIKSQNLQGPLVPCFGDLDGDGDMDLLLGVFQGHLNYYVNTAGPGNPAVFVFSGTNFMNIDIGNVSTPQLVDLNRDGKPDLVIGEQNGILNYFENTGTISSPSFSSSPTIDTLGRVIVRQTGTVDGFSVPFFFEDSIGYRLAVSNMTGQVFLYNNIDNNLNGTFTLTDTLIHAELGFRYGYNLGVSGGDINGDGKTDLVFGMYGGGVKIYLQGDSTVSVGNAAFVENNLALLPNPASESVSLVLNSSGNGGKEVVVFNATGAVMLSNRWDGMVHQLHVQNWPAGIYFVQVRTSTGLATRKLIIVR